MEAFDLVVGNDPAPEEVLYLEDRIDEFNTTATGIGNGAWLTVLVRDDRGRIVAGLCGGTWSDCCEIRQLWVDLPLRKRGLGTRLLDAAEREALRRGCCQVFLMTYSFQAPGFYFKHGFRLVAMLSGYPSGHANLLLRKQI
jgi:GNAT superfamily N-acetyltransferase